ncbi:hypothetical protein [Falsibacillus albus]|uniref:Uncharacterized protein n=1 Tax=Falsibacillus albus TaxID=2478915 RepID=A0A3L7JYQ6_9BACI|nr:hypothetical protein [Falsibacillus albus]RLQ95394.1 hypothetical protein D9X91_10165 [Falsibacillus albus]
MFTWGKKKKIKQLEKKLDHVAESYTALSQWKEHIDQTLESLKKLPNQPNIQIETLQVDKIIVEQLQYSNNFGQLGIKELTGKLNIGTSYEGKTEKDEDSAPTSPPQGPKLNMMPRKVEEKLEKTNKKIRSVQKNLKEKPVKK